MRRSIVGLLGMVVLIGVGEKMAEMARVPVSMISVGPSREQTIILQ